MLTSDIVDLTNSFDINKLAYAVAMQETKNCTLGYWQMYNNCFWIKQWNTAPCQKVGMNRMCIYNNPEESYEAFKKIRQNTWYAWIPNLKKAQIWSGHDRAEIWLKNVFYYYNK